MINLGQNSLKFLTTPGMQRCYNWDVVFPDLSTPKEGGGLVGMAKSALGLVAGVAVGRYCQSIRIGQYDIKDIIEMKAAGRQRFSAGQMSINSMTATFVVPAPDIIASYFRVWRNSIIDNQGFYSPTKAYKKKVRVVLSGRNGIPSNMLTVDGVFPRTFPAWDLSYSDEKVITYSIEFQIDNLPTGTIEESLLNVAQGVGEFASGVASKVGGFF